MDGAHRRAAGHPGGQGACDAGAGRAWPVPSASPGSARAARTTPAPSVPEGSRAMAGIGCHFMAIWMDRATVGLHPDGRRGRALGRPAALQPPTSTCSPTWATAPTSTAASLAVRQSIAAGVNITYKILYNDAVAMTGGQQVGERPEGHSVVQIAQSMRAEGAVKIIIVTDEPEKYDGVKGLPRASPSSTATRSMPCSASSARSRAPRSSSTTRPAPPKSAAAASAAPWSTRPSAWSSTSWCAKVAATAACSPTACRWSRWRPNSAASARSTRAPATRTIPASRASARASSPSKAASSRKRPKARRASPFELGALPEPRAAGRVDGKAWGIVVAGVGGTGVITIGQLLGVAGAPRRQGHRHAGRRRPGAKGRRNLEPCADRRHARTTSAPPVSAWRRPT